MKERPILFSGPMVRALLAGTKTQTRRIAKDVRHPDLGNVYSPGALVLEREPQHVIERSCPYGQPGDRLWVRESYRFAASLDGLAPNAVGETALDAGYRTPWAPTQFEADGARAGAWHGFDTLPIVTVPGKLRPAIHMPRWACRIMLEITGVRVARLQTISEADARAEGVIVEECHKIGYCAGADRPPAIRAFRELWESINGAESWQANPWVWAVEFKRTDGQRPRRRSHD
ncbi:Uncharacterised protein [Bordetella ansorpii]|uniref:ASCH domain-containing protein n=1 Tax=Bordetella ansorpii TaxID=288768 RepID=A0A157RNT7_9BORD|nr:hypothetical protein [Bordetella ansorpii]SAI59109.1 Uncharacterised protein [Bordetella ansorpii]